MQKHQRFFLLTLLAATVFWGGSLATPGASSADDSLDNASAVSCPTLTLQHWQDSTQQEKLAFLFGFATLLEIERDWQHKKPLPVSRSLNGIWVKGLSAVSLDEIVRDVDKYIAAHPDQLDEPVLKVMANLYVSPKLSQAERRQARDRWEEIKHNR